MKRLLTLLLLLSVAALGQEVGTTQPSGPITSNGTTTTIGGSGSQPTTINGLLTVNGGITAAALSAPGSPTAVQLASTGGFLLHNQAYFYKITATNATGETLPSSEATFTTGASPVGDTYSATVSWAAVTGATGYKVYRSTTTNTELLLATVAGGTTTSYTDNTNTTPSGAIPVANSSSQVVLPVGVAATPPLTFTGDLTTGIYHSGAGQVDVSIAGSDLFRFSNSGGSGQLNLAGGAGLLLFNASTTQILQAGSGLIITGAMNQTSNRVALTADWTCGNSGTVASCTAATIIGSGGGVPLTFTLPLSAQSYKWECDLVVGQATAATANNWNMITATNGATNVTAAYDMFTAAGVKLAGATTDQASTTTTFSIGGAWTLGGTGTKMPVHIWGEIEAVSASGTVVSLQLIAPTVADVVTIYRGSNCTIR